MILPLAFHVTVTLGRGPGPGREFRRRSASNAGPGPRRHGAAEPLSSPGGLSMLDAAAAGPESVVVVFVRQCNCSVQCEQRPLNAARARRRVAAAATDTAVGDVLIIVVVWALLNSMTRT